MIIAKKRLKNVRVSGTLIRRGEGVSISATIVRETREIPILEVSFRVDS